VIAFKDISTFHGEQVSIKSCDDIDRENNFLRQLDNQYIMSPAKRLLAKTIEDSQRNARFEYLCPRAEGELGKIIFQANENLKPALAVKYALHVAQGLEYLHTVCNFVHRDIKHENVLILGGVAKIADFGSVLKGEKLDQLFINGSTNGVSQPSPEAVIRKDDGTVENGFPLDMWAFGVCLFELMSPNHEKPYFCQSGFGGCAAINPPDHEKMLFKKWVAKNNLEACYQALVVLLLKFDKPNRISAKQTVLYLKEKNDLTLHNQ
jgi:serine/threonine protein kinase